MELSQHYTPAATEERWYKHWISKGYFNSTPDSREPFTVVIPPPNVTGVLHMGHTLNETVQDILVRRARMSGKNACWVPGSDHASIATETKVVQMLKERGIEKSSLTRQEFLQYAFEWKEKYGGIIYHQIEKLGCSVDWNRVTFTMDDHYYAAVIKVFMDLYEKGLIYRGARMINWDPAAKTALSDEEVEHKDGTGKLFYVKYALENAANEEEYIMIATQRPETIMGDTGVCVNPSDERYTQFKGRKAIVPIVNRTVPIIFDDYVDPAFGTGALKVTPAHDINDYNLGLKYALEIIDTLNEDGTMSVAAEVFVGEDRFVARKKVVALLKEQGLLAKEEEYATRLGYSQRSGAMVEPRISTQWFVKMKDLAEPALEAVVSGQIKIHPGDRFLATYKYWLENVKDWCISRQLWWGQQIPAWYDTEGKMVIAATHAEALEKYTQQFGVVAESLKQDEDCLDTWFSSWLWPLEVFKDISNPNNADAKYYYPTQVLVTGQDIIFFWVARMVMAGMHYANERPFADVYFTGMVRDDQGRKMSKQLGNSPDLLELIDEYGADAVRFGIMISSPAGNDLLFDKKSLEQGKNFNNKMWNALKLLKMWEGRQAEEASADSFAIEWFANRLNEVKAQVDVLMKDFKLSEALKVIYSLVWDDFCSWYLEWVKPGFEQPIAASVYGKTIFFYGELVQLLHPFMPFITEEIFHLLQAQTIDLCVKQNEPIVAADKTTLAKAELLKKVITALREARAKNQIKPKETIALHIQSVDQSSYDGVLSILAKQVNADGAIRFANETVPQSIVVAVEKEKFYILADLQIDMAAQKEKLLADLQHQQGFLNTVMKKLGNEKFVQNAKPEVLAIEQKKKADAEVRIKVIEESLASL